MDYPDRPALDFPPARPHPRLPVQQDNFLMIVPRRSSPTPSRLIRVTLYWKILEVGYLELENLEFGNYGV